jgi:hypothetical protein
MTGCAAEEKITKAHLIASVEPSALATGPAGAPPAPAGEVRGGRGGYPQKERKKPKKRLDTASYNRYYVN